MRDTVRYAMRAGPVGELAHGALVAPRPGAKIFDHRHRARIERASSGDGDGYVAWRGDAADHRRHPRRRLRQPVPVELLDPEARRPRARRRWRGSGGSRRRTSPRAARAGPATGRSRRLSPRTCSRKSSAPPSTRTRRASASERARVVDRAEDEGRDDGVEAAVVEGQVLGRRLDHRRSARPRRLRPRAARAAARPCADRARPGPAR